MDLYVDRQGGEYYTWFYSEGSRHKFMANYDLDVIYQKAKKQGFDKAILTKEASEFYYEGMKNPPTKVKLKEVKSKIEQKVRREIRRIAESILTEDGNMVPSKVRYTVMEGLKSIKRIMAILEQATNGNIDGSVSVDSFWETYDTVLDEIRKKLDQIDSITKRSR